MGQTVHIAHNTRKNRYVAYLIPFLLFMNHLQWKYNAYLQRDHIDNSEICCNDVVSCVNAQARVKMQSATRACMHYTICFSITSL